MLEVFEGLPGICTCSSLSFLFQFILVGLVGLELV